MADFQVAEAFRPLTPDEYEELKASIDEFGVLVPIVKDENGQTIDGIHREKIAAELGIDLEAEGRILRFDSEGDAEAVAQLAYDLNVHRRQISTEDRDAAIVRLRKEGYAMRSIAAQVGVSTSTVANVTKDVPKEEITGRLSSAPVTAESPVDRWQEVVGKWSLSQSKVAELTGVKQSTISKDRKALAPIIEDVEDVDTKKEIVRVACAIADDRGGNRVPTPVELKAARLKVLEGVEPSPPKPKGKAKADSSPEAKAEKAGIRAIEVTVRLDPDLYGRFAAKATTDGRVEQDILVELIEGWVG